MPALMKDSVIAGKDSLYVSVVVDTKTNEIIIKLVNVNPSTKTVNIHVAGMGKLSKKAVVTLLTCNDLQAENSIEQPARIIPMQNDMKVSGKMFAYEAPAGSISVIRLIRN